MRLAFGRLREWRIPAAERAAAREECRAEQAIRREHGSRHRAEKRAAALESEARRQSTCSGHGAARAAATSGAAEPPLPFRLDPKEARHDRADDIETRLA
jgi:hypothetical protein